MTYLRNEVLNFLFILSKLVSYAIFITNFDISILLVFKIIIFLNFLYIIWITLSFW